MMHGFLVGWMEPSSIWSPTHQTGFMKSKNLSAHNKNPTGCFQCFIGFYWVDFTAIEPLFSIPNVNSLLFLRKTLSNCFSQYPRSLRLSTPVKYLYRVERQKSKFNSVVRKSINDFLKLQMINNFILYFKYYFT